MNYKKAEKAIDKNEAALREDRMADYKFASSREGAIFAALQRSLRKTGRRVSRQNDRILDRMAAIVARQRAGRRTVARAQGEAVDRYGGAFAGEAAAAFRPARTSARTGTDVAEKHEHRAEHSASNAGRIVQIAQAGAREAEAGAEYALNMALGERSQADANTIAQQRFELQMARIQQAQQLAAMEKQAQLDFENWKKQQEFLQNGGLGKGGQASSLVGQDLAGLLPDIRQALEDNPDAGAAEILQSLGDSIPPGAEAYVARLIQTVKNRGLFGGDSPSGTYKEGVDAIVDSMVALNPEWDKPKLRAALEKAVEAQLRATYNRASAQALSQELQAATSSNSFAADPQAGGPGTQVFGSGSLGGF